MTIPRLISFLRVLLYGILIFTPFVYLERAIYPYISVKTAFFMGSVELLLGGWIALCLMDRQFLPRRNMLFIAFFVLVLLMLGTSLFGIDPLRSIWSTQERATGVFFWAHLFFFVLCLATFIRERLVSSQTLLWVIALTATVVSLLGLIQFKIPNLFLEEPVGSRPGSTFGNPTFLAGYLVFSIFFSFLLLRTSTGKWRWVAGIASLIQIIMLLGTQTRGDLLGVAVGFLSLLVWFFVVPPFSSGRFATRLPYGIFLSFLLLSGASFWMTRTASFWQSIPGFSRLADTSLTNDAPRLIAWRAAWEGFREKPFLGWGWENYNVVFNAHYDPQLLASGYGETRFDKPHNIYLEYLVAGGIPLFLAFLFLLFSIFRGILRYSLVSARPFLLAAVLGYLVRSFFVFDTLGPLLLLGVLIALLAGDQERSPSLKSAASFSFGGYVAIGIACLSIYLIQVRTVSALGHQYDGYRLMARGSFSQGIDAFAAARYFWTPYTYDFAKDYALVTIEAYFYNPDRVSPEQAIRAIDAFATVTERRSHDAYYHYVLIDLCNQVYALNPTKYGALAEQEAKTAFQLSPRRQQIYFSFAKTKQLEGDLPGALALVQQGIELTPMLPDGYFYYSLLSFTNGDGVQGYSFYRRSLELGKQWKNYYERITTAGFLANYGYFADAIPLYRAAIEEIKDPIEKTDARVKLAVALFMTGDRVEAKSLLTAIAARYDLTTSPLYGDLAPILKDLGISP